MRTEATRSWVYLESCRDLEGGPAQAGLRGAAGRGQAAGAGRGRGAGERAGAGGRGRAAGAGRGREGGVAGGAARGRGSAGRAPLADAWSQVAGLQVSSEYGSNSGHEDYLGQAGEAGPGGGGRR